MKATIYNYSTWLSITEPKVLDELMVNNLQDAGFVVLSVNQHHFKPHGWTALYLLAESHLAIHTFPEHNTTYIELSSCVKKQFDNFVKSLSNAQSK